jgi:hypothetical protein
MGCKRPVTARLTSVLQLSVGLTRAFIDIRLH